MTRTKIPREGSRLAAIWFRSVVLAPVLSLALHPNLVQARLSPVPASISDVGLSDAPDPGRRGPVGNSQQFSKLPLYFVENQGQVDARVAYYVEGGDTSISFTSRGLIFTTFGSSEARPDKRTMSAKNTAGPHLVPLTPGLLDEQPGPLRRHTLTLDFVAANPAVNPVGREATPAVVSYFSGRSDRWKTGLRTWSEVVYSDLWPGIDLVYSGSTGRLKYTFVVEPGADSEQIQLAYRGATAARINDEGQLEVTTPVQSFRDDKPYAYQMVDGNRVEVAASYTLWDEAASPGNRSAPGVRGYGFRVGDYDRSRPLVLDPAVFIYAGYIGTNLDDRGLGIAVDSFGSAYLVGQAPNLFTLSYDAYIAKVNPFGTGFDYIATLGGTEFDAAFDVAVDADGNAYMTGGTFSDDFTFPIVGGPDLTFNGGRSDVFVAKVNAFGTALIYSGYIGGKGFDFAEGIVVDDAGNAYVTGPTDSRESSFPATVGPDLTYNGRWDIFVAKVKANPTSPIVTDNLEYCGYIGGGGNDAGVFSVGGPGGKFITSGHIAIDVLGNAYVSGMTGSRENTFPNGKGFGALPGADQTHNGGYDAFVVKVNFTGAGFLYATYIGGSGEDLGFGMKVDLAGNAYITGRTDSTEATFPVTVGPDLTYNGGEVDAFAAKIDPFGTSLVYCGFLGGADQDQGLGVALDDFGNLYVIGHTHSPDFPVIGGPDVTYNGVGGNGDAFVTTVKPVPSDPVVTNNFEYSGFIGGAGDDSAFWIALDTLGNAYIVGDTDSDQTTFPDGDGLGSLTSPFPFHNGGFDGFVVKIGPDVGAPPPPR